VLSKPVEEATYEPNLTSANADEATLDDREVSNTASVRR
jgi:hypothetical protein